MGIAKMGVPTATDSLVGTMIKIKADTHDVFLCNNGRLHRDQQTSLLVVEDYVARKANHRIAGPPGMVVRYLVLSKGRHRIRVKLNYTMSSEV